MNVRLCVVCVTHRKVDDLQFAVEETSIDKGDLEVGSVLWIISNIEGLQKHIH